MSDFKPGIYPDVPEHAYHSREFGPADSLSSTEAKRILRAPSVMRWHRDNPEPPKAAFDLGHVVHALVLGTGLPIHVHDHPDLRTKAAKEEAADARLAGMVPIKRAEYEEMQAVANAVLTHEAAGPLFENGEPEQSMYAVDADTGVWMRGRLDWFTRTADGAPVLADLKTAVSAVPDEWMRQAANLEYGVQREWYRSMWTAITGERDPRFLHVIVEKTAPYLVSVCEMGFDFEHIGKQKMRRALDTYKQCLDTGVWPGIAPTIHPAIPPMWYIAQEESLEAEIEV